MPWKYVNDPKSTTNVLETIRAGLRGLEARAHYLTPNAGAVVGPPTSGTWDTDELYVDSQRSIWLCISGGTPGTWKQIVPAVVSGAPFAVLTGTTKLLGADPDALAQFVPTSLVDRQYVMFHHDAADADMVYQWMATLGAALTPWRIESNHTAGAGFRLVEVRKNGTTAKPNISDTTRFHETAIKTTNGVARETYDPTGFTITT